MNMISTHSAKSEADTIEIAQKLAQSLDPQDTLFLRGDLGAGKTVFARALIRALCDAPNLEVISPTFTLVQTYDAQNHQIHHYDLYRLEACEEIFELGWEDSLTQSLTLIEWPERLGAYTPASHLDIHITNVENQNNHRTITIERNG